jgi:hypothetical protein
MDSMKWIMSCPNCKAVMSKDNPMEPWFCGCGWSLEVVIRGHIQASLPTACRVCAVRRDRLGACDN